MRASQWQGMDSSQGGMLPLPGAFFWTQLPWRSQQFDTLATVVGMHDATLCMFKSVLGRREGERHACTFWQVQGGGEGMTRSAHYFKVVEEVQIAIKALQPVDGMPLKWQVMNCIKSQTDVSDVLHVLQFFWSGSFKNLCWRYGNRSVWLGGAEILAIGGSEGGGVAREREREIYFKSHISLWEHSSHFRLIGRGVPSVSVVSQLMYKFLCLASPKENPQVPM